MEDKLFANDRSVYQRQVGLLTFFLVMTYKIVMLPKYLSMDAPRDFVIGAIVVSLVEMLMFSLVYYIIRYTKVCDMYGNKHVSRAILLLIAVSSMLKLLVLSVETLDYISTMLFQEGRWLFIILTLLPALGYIAYKGANTIARLSEVVIWMVIFSFLFTLLFLKADLELDNILPLFDEGAENVLMAYTKHSMWFGDFLPLLVLEMDKPRTKLDRLALPLGLSVSYAIMLGFFVLYVALYGDVAPYISYAFSNIGIYNSISSLLGGVDFPIVCVWLLMAIVKLAFLLYAVSYSIETITPKFRSNKARGVVVAIIVLAIMLILSFAIEGVDDMYYFATSNVRYVVLIIDYTLPIILGVTVKVKKKQYR